MKKVLITFLTAIVFSVSMANNVFAVAKNPKYQIINIEFKEDIKVKGEDLSVAITKPNKIQFLFDFFDFKLEGEEGFDEFIGLALDQGKIEFSTKDDKGILIQLEEGLMRRESFEILDTGKLGGATGKFELEFKIDSAAVTSKDGSSIKDELEKYDSYILSFQAPKEEDGTFDYSAIRNELKYVRAENKEEPKQQPNPTVPAEEEKKPTEEKAIEKKPVSNEDKMSEVKKMAKSDNNLLAPNTGVETVNYELSILSAIGILGFATYFIIKK